MQSIEHVVIAAAGLGSRLGKDTPKCLVDIGSEKLISRQLKLLEDFKDIRLVVGFREKEVIKHVTKMNKRVLFVRNSNYVNTSTCTSFYLGSRGLSFPFLLMDGDLVINPKSFDDFKKICLDNDGSVLSYTEVRTDDPVYLHLDETEENIVGFSRDKPSPYEWSGVACVKGIEVSDQYQYLYQVFEPHLPLKAAYLDCYEIDTVNDLNHAISMSKKFFENN